MQSQQTLGGRYVLGEVLGRGGMSVVHRGHDEVLGRDVAVKLLAGTDAADRGRIRAEARAAARLSHPNVTNVYDYGESASPTGAVPYVVMELLSGQTLARRLAAGPLPPHAGLRACAEVAGALAAAHAQGLVHRDIKPSNVMLTPTGAKVLDFGIAAAVGAPEIDPDGRLMGTPAYLAPERLTAGEVVPASDVYALGLLLHRVLTARLPWHSETTTQMLKAHVYVEPADLPHVDGLPEAVRDLCRRCLAKDPADRPSATEAERVLVDAAGLTGATGPAGHVGPAGAGGPDPAVPPERPRSRRRALVVAGVAAAVLAVTAALTDPLGDGRTGDRTAGPSPTGSDPAAPTGTGGPGPAGGGEPGPAATGGPGPTGIGAGTVGPGPAPSGVPVPAPSGAGPTTSPRSGAGPSGGAGPAPTRAASPTPAAPRSPDPTAGSPITALGGVVTVLCVGKLATVVSLVPRPGYEVKDYDPGPADEVQVVLLSADNESEIKVKCERGRPVPKIKESRQ
ncbi:serine/threonine-protein kinase [Micromonospora endolithica]|uniref:serine/threonine-protein kinase n=1 Tax=Micromonospora endolithica TaxID=230091 RepID=UPI0011AC43CF|nr:serine/threonine-protein kinase [Micromonospora endolithica]TWJ25520.1 serine/threonine-protein kinase [Micromonospora endolithica]